MCEAWASVSRDIFDLWRRKLWGCTYCEHIGRLGGARRRCIIGPNKRNNALADRSDAESLS